MEEKGKTLKPCECGGLVELYDGHGYVQCADCDKSTKSYHTDERAIKAWNDGELEEM